MSTSTGMETFPHPTLTPIDGKPTPLALQHLKRELVANAMAVPSTRGGGNHGHLSLIMSTAELFLITGGEPFTAPIHPGQPPVHPNGATNAQIHVADTTYTRAMAEYATYISTRNALRTMILAAIHPTYYTLLSDTVLGYANVTPMDLLRHLFTTYGTISAEDLEANRNALKAPWNPDDDIAILWTRVKECQNFARSSSEPIPDSIAILLILEALTTSGVLSHYINEWKVRASDDKTYANFTAYFDRANKVRLESTTATQAGYHTANATTASTVTPSPHPTTASADRSSTSSTVRADNVDLFYCWTHGLGRNPKHTSKTCKNPAANHRQEATFHDTQGGTNTFQNEASNRRNNRNRPNTQA